MRWYESLAFGGIGGILPDVLRIVAARYDGPPKYLSSLFFWVSLVILVVLGGVTALAIRPTDMVAAFAVGFGAPEIISRVLARPGDRSPDAPLLTQLRSWWKE